MTEFVCMLLKRISLVTLYAIGVLLAIYLLREPSLITYFPEEEREDFAKVQREVNHALEKMKEKEDKEVVDALKISFAYCSVLEETFKKGESYVFSRIVIINAKEVRLCYGSAYLLLEGLERELKKRGYTDADVDKMKEEALEELDKIIEMWMQGKDFFASLASGSA